MKRKCIFHYPAPIEFEGSVGSAIRPEKIYNALKERYDVDVVCGYAGERKNHIEVIKEKIKKGVKYDFMYSESLTQPMILSEKNHIPKYPFLDFGFFKFCKRYNIPIGLFYRDFYWKFPIYKENVKKWISYVTIPFYKYELKMYEKFVDVLYLPSIICKQYIDLNVEIKSLPPGSVIKTKSKDKRIENILNLFYVGGVSGLYDIVSLVKGASKFENIKLTVCCPQDDWEKNKERYELYLTENIKIIHERGNGLEKYYDKADVACLYFSNNEYRDMAMPIKLFEYIGHSKPIISNSKTAAAEFIQENDLGWIIDYDDNNLVNLLIRLLKDKDEIMKKTLNVQKTALMNTWEKRVETIAKDLT